MDVAACARLTAIELQLDRHCDELVAYTSQSVKRFDADRHVGLGALLGAVAEALAADRLI
jgi:hypothetical protein